MNYRLVAASTAAAMALLMAGSAAADTTALAVTCAGVAGATSITWTASTTGGVAPVGLLWGNGATTSPIVVSETPGTYNMTIQANDASSSVATSTCSATVIAPASPTISAFTATPSTITLGQSSVLAWTVNNASSTSLDQGIGAVSSTSITVSPSVTTTYALTATNPNGSVTAQASVTVGTSTSQSVADQIKALLAQIAALQQQLAQLIASRVGSTTPGTGTLPPGQIGKLACEEFGQDLKLGDRGSDVMKLQQILLEDPSSGFSASTTGFFGRLTQQALIRYQLANGITSSASSTTGYFGPLTRGFFSRSCGKGLIKNSERETSSSGNGSTTAGTAIAPYNQGNQNGNSNGEGHGNSGNHGNPHDN